MKHVKDRVKEFFATSWAIDNKTSIYVLTCFIALVGISSYNSIPKEQFPEIVIPTIIVNTIYPGTSPVDMENLVTRPMEKDIKAASGVKKITSKSLQDVSSIVVEFNTDVDVREAKDRVKDAVDKARPRLPQNLPTEPTIKEIDFSEFPIMNIQLSGNYTPNQLNEFAEVAQDKIEGLKEITRVDIIGAPEREIFIDMDMYKMQAALLTFSDVQRAVASENMTISAGNVSAYGMKRSIRVIGQFPDVETIKNIALKSSGGALVYLKDVADVYDGFKEQESFSRLNGKNVITLNVIKKSGQNLLIASDKIQNILDHELKNKEFPSDLSISVTGEQSRFTRNTLEELNNTIIIGFILVTIVLMFFMGVTNAFFVAMSVPLSMAIAYMIMPGLGFTMNMIVMFGFIFALGIVVDDAIVVIENTHRTHQKQPDIVLAAKQAAGEVFLPILSGTLTTLAPFFPLAFWPGIVGQFMHYMPVTLIITLFASLFVAYIINPVFAVSFMKHENETPSKKQKMRSLKKKVLWLLGIALFFYIIYAVNHHKIVFALANAAVLGIVLVISYYTWLGAYISWWQGKAWPACVNLYERTMVHLLKGNRSWGLFGGVIVLFVVTMVLVGIAKPQVVFFPDNEPNTIDVLIRLPVGTDQKVTDSITSVVEQKVDAVLGKNNPVVESVLANVALGAGSGSSVFDNTTSSEKGKVTVNFVEYKYRHGASTTDYLNKIRDEVKGMPGVEIYVEKNRMGPPTGKPINIEISSENLKELIEDADGFKKFIQDKQIKGIEELKSDVEAIKPEINVNIDRKRANNEGISTAQIASELRTAVLGLEVSKYKEEEDEYPITLRYNESTRENIDNLLDMRLTFRDANTGIIRSVPLSSVASIDYSATYGGINRLNLKRVITLSSEVLPGYTANEIIAKIKQIEPQFSRHNGVTISFTGEQEDQQETVGFLGKAMMIAIGLIFFILITQFNSISKTVLILSEIIFSIIGVFLGIVIFNMTISVIMSGLGIVALAGIVVRNGILIVEFIDELRARGMRTRQAILEAGKIRITPVILTATATILGLVPLAIGLNINFATLFTDLNPHLHVGGDNVMFWGPLSWAIIFGLTFATFLTLIFVPAMYLAINNLKIRIKRRKSNSTYRKALKNGTIIIS